MTSFLLFNFLSFALYSIHYLKIRFNQKPISRAMLIFYAVCGGVGSFIGFFVYQLKMDKKFFKILVWCFILHLIIGGYTLWTMF